ncbi:glycine betaine ABC transporter substrate-binding protein [Siccirubricoccus deserti]
MLRPGIARSAPLLRVGSKNFTEQLVVGELFAQALEAAGARVERRLNLGGTAIAQRALTSGEIDLYPEYTGTGLGVVLRQPPEGDAASILARVRAGYEAEFDCTWLDPSGIDNGNALLVLPATARRHGLTTLSDLARVAPQLTLAAGNDSPTAPMGCLGCDGSMAWIPPLSPIAALGLRYAALAHGQADVVNAYATDWQIAVGGYTVLRDDRGLWPPYQLAAVVRRAALRDVPGLADPLLAIGARLDNPVMQELNRQVDQDGDEPREVAARFRSAQGLG